MRRFDPELWSGVLVIVICAALGVPVLVLELSGRDVAFGPWWLWWCAYAGFLVALFVSTWLQDVLARRVVVTAFAAQVVLGAAVVLLAPGAGWTSILLVFTAALSGYVVPRRATAAIIVGNTAVVLVAAALSTADVVETLLSGLLYLLLQGASVFAVMSQQRDSRAQRELAEAHTELGATSALLAESSRSDERLRISRELHDLIGHQLTALTLELEVAAHHSTEPGRHHVLRARHIARELLGDVRTTVGELRERAPDLRTTLERITGELPRPAVHLVVHDDVRADEEGTTVLVRCVQEIVTNTIRHTTARNLWIDVAMTEQGGLTLSAVDDGPGADPVRPGHGLRGIQERVTALGGRVAFAGERGFRVTAEVPLR
ncbi:two-component sensor histidine kinase [Saccharomonospora piscinae]|uniref:Two-component sensor histidine kinase n=1 Tax=Saccharomonospora piscinae TaxID=687388 RepID=A0A1V9A726_SACPI|nr:histidine kinase [Saccharomonospora piscinae]OQO92922.1 two-component sensor histidine kinase [Saccharomonospora piscinae]TLW93060.1 two-component sensor histidine kinase [Saccharomonospora piscinae]